MGVTTTQTNKPLNPRGNDQSPLAYNRAKLFSGKALDFDGVNDEVLSTITISGAKTYCAWINADATSNCRIVSMFTGGYSNITFSNNKFNMYDGTNIPETTTTFETDQWYFVVAVQEANNAKIYVNGISQPLSTTNWVEHTYTSATIAIGRDAAGSTAWFDGEISGVRVFNTALTAAQVADLYNNPEKVVPTGVANTALKLFLPMQEGAGTTAYDGSGNGNHGTISGATYTHGIGAPVAQTAVIDWNKSHNYIDKSEEFETASWSENRLVTITDDSFIAPDGSATATEIVETTANDSHFLAQTLSVTAGDYFISAYVKKRDYDWVQLSTGGDTSRYANFNISTGATGNASDITELIIEDAGNGWYRIGGKLTTSSTSFNYFITLIQSDVASRFQTYTGTDKGQYIWGAQATKSATLQPYLRNIGTSAVTAEVLLPQGLTTGRDITGVNLFENVRKQGALNLDGNSWAEVHDNASLDYSSEVTLETWIYWTGEDDKGILGKWHGPSNQRSLMLYSNTATKIVGLYSSTGSTTAGFLTPSQNLAAGNWYHVAFTSDGSTIKIYIDGVEGNSASYSSGFYVSDENLEIATYQTDEAKAHNGPIAQPRIYNRALTASEVLRNYNSGKNTYTND